MKVVKKPKLIKKPMVKVGNKKKIFKIKYYVRYPGPPVKIEDTKTDINILTTNNNKWKSVYFFRKEYIPMIEEDYFINGSYYSFHIPTQSNSILNHKMNQFIEYMKNYDWIGGIILTKKIYNQNIMEVKVWSIQSKENKDIYAELKRIFEYSGKIQFGYFYPEPAPGQTNLSLVHLRRKKVYLLRYDTALTRKMYYENEWWEIFMLSYFKKYYRPHSNVIDIGGNVGTHSLLLSEVISPQSKVYVFEPVYADIIQMNVDQNHLQKQIVVYNEGVGNKNEIIQVPVYDRDCAINFGRFSLKSNDTILVPTSNYFKKCKKTLTNIPIVTLDSKNFTDISIIKIDVEGMELQVLEGAIETIRREKPVIFMEIWKRKKKETLSFPIFQKLIKELHYKLIYIKGYYDDDYLLVPPSS